MPPVLGGVGVHLVVQSGDVGINSGALHLVAVRKGRIVEGGVTMSPHFMTKFP
jgi:hypothetical protein